MKESDFVEKPDWFDEKIINEVAADDLIDKINDLRLVIVALEAQLHNEKEKNRKLKNKRHQLFSGIANDLMNNLAEFYEDDQ